MKTNEKPVGGISTPLATGMIYYHSGGALIQGVAWTQGLQGGTSWKCFCLDFLWLIPIRKQVPKADLRKPRTKKMTTIEKQTAECRPQTAEHQKSLSKSILFEDSSEKPLFQTGRCRPQTADRRPQRSTNKKSGHQTAFRLRILLKRRFCSPVLCCVLRYAAQLSRAVCFWTRLSSVQLSPDHVENH